MTHRLLHIQASPRPAQSISNVLANHFLDRFRQAEPGLFIDRLDLWEEALPDLDGSLLSAKYAVLSKRPLSHDEADAWNIVTALIDRVRLADSVLVATPMWNFGIPYKLKHWIDLITQPGLSFAFDPQSGYRPLLPRRPLTVILASSGDYSAGPSWGRPDLASPYLDAAFRFLGFDTPDIVLAGPTAGDPERQEAARTAARAHLDSLVLRHQGLA